MQGTSTLGKAVRGAALLLAAGTALAAACASALGHVRSTPGLVDGWPGGAVGFGLSCGVTVLLASTATLRLLRVIRSGPTELRARYLPWAVLCAALGTLSGVYGLAVVPPRWCYQSLSPRCDALPGAAEAGLAFQATLIGAFFLNGAVMTCASGARAARQERLGPMARPRRPE
ncbi:hypothetical protein E0L36_01995 [Streptomyces sp. AJS327]|uniref:hypothetical protein n=1 Tax=Streptomyces sp. AJS327 TaxID=2545265 RepID=UPI0015DFFDE0|nr:hypothetical protein [Streptomyces sp. AJS327]MBA0049717.1 hypothetical protein [Streptomyces sp. AJS327]